MTAMLSSDPFDQPQADVEVSGDDTPSLDLGMATACVRDGVLMVFGPEGDPIPPQVVIAVAARQPSSHLGYGDEERVSAERVAVVLEAQMRGPVAPGASELDAAAWIEGMLGLGEEIEDESDARLETEPPEDETPSGFDGAFDPPASSELSPAPGVGVPLVLEGLDSWSPEPLDLEIPETEELAPFDLFNVDVPDLESETPAAAEEAVVGDYDLDPANEEPGDPDEIETSASEPDPIPEPVTEAIPVDDPREAQPDPEGSASAPGPVEVGPADVDPPEIEPAEEEQVAWQPPHSPDEVADSVPADDAPPTAMAAPTIRFGTLGLPENLVLEQDGVLWLGCFGEAAARQESPIVYARIDGVPDGAILTVGRDEGDGSWSLTEDDLARVSLVTSKDLEDFQLGLLLTTGERGDLRDAVDIVIARSGPEEGRACHAQEGARSVSLVFRPPLSPQNDLCRFALVQIAGVPASASLSKGCVDQVGAWMIPAADLDGLEIRFAAGDDQTVTIKASAISIDERDGTMTTIEQDLTIAPGDRYEPASPGARSAWAAQLGHQLELGPSLEEIGGEADLTAIAVSGLAGGMGLSVGTFDDETGSWILRPGDLADLRLEPFKPEFPPLHLKITGIRVDPVTGEPEARSTSLTVGRDPGPSDLPTRVVRPGGVGFFRPFARRQAAAPA